jgi:hypothetical protein
MAPIMSASVFHAAIGYAGRGFEIMPRVHGGGGDLIDALDGSPRTGLMGVAEVRAYWAARPGTRALAAVCGPASDLLVIDVDQHGDGPDGLAELRRLEAEHGPLPPTPFVISPSGAGRHLHFRWPGGRVRNGALAPGIEVLGDRMAATLPPSQKRGTAYYHWSLSRHPDYLPRAELPPWLVAMMRPSVPERRRRIRPRLASSDRYSRAALLRESQAVAAAPVGERNNVLNRAAWALARFIPTGALERGEVERTLFDAAMAAGLPPPGARATIRSAVSRRVGP